MAIINTFAKCLESPYLVEDHDAPKHTGALIAQAEERLAQAFKIHEIHDDAHDDPADVLYLAHEAMYCCARALVHAKGYREFSLRCLMLACQDLYVRAGLLDIDLLHQCEHTLRLKLTPAEALAAAEALLARTRSLLAEGSRGENEKRE